MTWRTNRRQRLPADWDTRRARVLHRDPSCRIAGPTCTGTSTEVDHIRHGDDHSYGNLQGVCATCHMAKTQQEARAARVSEKRPRERHPGLR